MITLDSESFDENYGEVIAGALAWSGNFRLNFEVDEFNVLNILAGANPYASDYTLGAGESFTTPEMIYTYSSEGAARAATCTTGRATTAYGTGIPTPRRCSTAGRAPISRSMPRRSRR